MRHGAGGGLMTHKQGYMHSLAHSELSTANSASRSSPRPPVQRAWPAVTSNRDPCTFGTLVRSYLECRDRLAGGLWEVY